MHKASLMMLLVASLPVLANTAPTNLEQVIDKARKDGATIIECYAGRCYNKDTFAPVLEPGRYAESPDGIYIEFANPADDAYKLLDDAVRITQETKDSLGQ